MLRSWAGVDLYRVYRVRRVARTLADLEGAATIRGIHIAEALAWRRVRLVRRVRI